MATIDIALPDELMIALQPPVCDSLRLPQPATRSLTLPTGGSFQGVADVTRGIPTECSMNVSLMLQVAPMMASMECLLDILKFIGALVDAFKSVTSPTNILPALGKIITAGEDLVKCLGMVIPPFVPTLCFLKDLLALVASLLLCTVQALEGVLKTLSGLQLQISAAQAAGNDDLVASLTCAQENAGTSAAGIMQSMQPVSVLMQLAGTFLSIAGQPPLTMTLPSAIDPSDLAGMQSMLQTLGTVAQDIKTIADAIPC
jgi:hypothetical protein